MESTHRKASGGASASIKVLNLTWDDIPVLTSQPDVIPEGWLSQEQFAELRGCCKSIAAKSLKAAVEQGLVEARDFKIQSGKSLSRKTFYKVREQR